MAYHDLRDFLAVLEQQGLLRRVTETVDPASDIGAMAKWAFQAVPEDERYGLRFDAVAGSDIPVALGALGASPRAYATGLGVEPDGINAKWEDALSNPVAPVAVTDAPCQEVVQEGGGIDLGAFPVPVWTPGKDAGPYITGIVVTKDAETGLQNYGIYRTMVLGPDRLTSNLSPGRQGGRCVQSWLRRGEPAPVAFVIGAEPAMYYAAVTSLPLGTDEAAIAGGLKGEPLELVQGQSVDLMIPARSEIVIEGFVHPGDEAVEGPFGEFAGYMGPAEPRPVVRVTRITHRTDPLFYGIASQIPPSESTTMQGLTVAGQLMKVLRRDLGETGIVDIAIDRTFGGLLGHLVAAVRTGPPGDGKRIGRLLADVSPCKRITVVDHDVDIRDPLHVDWAMNSCYDPARDTVIVDGVFVPVNMDPSVRVGGPTNAGSKIVVDATASVDAGPLSLPDRATMEAARETWRRAGLPDFDVPKRLKLRLDRA